MPLNEVLNNLGAAQSRRNSPEALDELPQSSRGRSCGPRLPLQCRPRRSIRQGKFEEAAASFRAVLDRNTEDTEATSMLGRCLQRAPGRKALAAPDAAPERLKLSYEESAYLQLKAVLEKPR